MARPRSMPEAFAARHRQAAQTRSAILRAAADVFAQAGLAGARTDAIARAAGVNKALLYYYFKSKDDLYRAVLEDHLREFSRRALGVLGGGGSPGATILRFVAMHFDFISTRPEYPALFHRFVMSGDAVARRLARRYMLPVRRRFISLIERGVREREFRQVDGLHTAISLAGLTVFYFITASAVGAIGRFDPFHLAQLKRRKEEVLNFVRYGLFRHPEARVG